MTNEINLLTVRQAAEKVDLSESRIRTLIRDGMIKAIMLGTEYLIDEKNLKKIHRHRRKADK